MQSKRSYHQQNCKQNMYADVCRKRYHETAKKNPINNLPLVTLESMWFFKRESVIEFFINRNVRLT